MSDSTQIMVSIHDKMAEVYRAPIVFKNEAVAIRTFSEYCNDKNQDANRFPDDFEIVLVGYWHDDTGIVEYTDLKVLAQAKEWINE